jgi:DNA polymerase-1
MMAKRYVVDIEADNLLVECTRCWIVAAYDIDTGEKHYWLEGDLGWKSFLDGADTIIGHNLLGFDMPALEKLFGYKLPASVSVHDTLIFSIVLNYKRFDNGSHNLATWGESLGYPKGHFEDFSHYTEEMLKYCIRDVELTAKVYAVVLKEFRALAEVSPQIRHYMRAEHAVAKWCSMAESTGWPFNKPEAERLMTEIDEAISKTHDKLMPLLGSKAIPVDKKLGVVEAKAPKWNKNGSYASNTASWFDIDPLTGQDEDRLIEGEYCRVTFADLDVNSVNDVKIFLYRNGWQPTTFNTKKDPITGRKVKTSAKITEDSLECMGGNGQVYCEFLTNKSRYSIIKGWVEACKPDGTIHGGCFTIGTPSMRARHSLIVNVPAADSVWGPEIRRLFISKPGWKMIGCDSAGNQARGLAHYLKSPEYTNLLLNGDIHSYNASALTAVLRNMNVDHTVPRGVAKRILYAFLFGAGGDTLWSYIFGAPNKQLGDKLKKGFLKSTPGFKELMSKLENIYGKTKQYGSGHGYIPGIAGNRIYCDSFHKLLVYLLQACEKATCGAALMLTMERLEAAGIPYQPCIMMHDEEDFLVPEEFAEQAAAIGKQAFIDGPKLFGVEIMDGEAKIGDNWYEVH